MLLAAPPLASGAAERSPSAGYLALLLIVLLFLATVLLIRNMSGRLKRLPKEFPPVLPPGQAPRPPEPPRERP